MSKKSIESRVLAVMRRHLDEKHAHYVTVATIVGYQDEELHGLTYDQIERAVERLYSGEALLSRWSSDRAARAYRARAALPTERPRENVPKKMSKDVPTFGQVLAAIIEHYRSNPDSTPSVVGCHENILPARLRHVDRRQVEDAFAWLLQAGAVTVTTSKYTPDACYAFVPGFQFDGMTAPPEPLKKNATPPSRIVALEHAVMDVFSRKDEHAWCSPLHILQQIHGPLRPTLSTVEVGGVCDRLVAQGKLKRSEDWNCGDSYRVLAPSEKVEARSVPDPDHDEEWYNHPAVIELLHNSQAALVEACVKMLYPNGDGGSINTETLPARLVQLVEDVKQYKELARTELNGRHAVEQVLADERVRFEKELDKARSDISTVRDELSTWAAKFAALDACYRGLFGKKGS